MKIFIVALIAIALIGLVGGGLYFVNHSAKPAASRGETAVAPAQKPWIEVISPPVSIIGADSMPIKALATGDELQSGAVIKTETGGRATVHFPDASLLRIDSETTFTLKAAEYDGKNQKLIVKIALAAGRLWSKIFALATPDSVWEVQTSNAVATVRGTAFGMEYKNKTSLVIGSENKVAVGILDPATKKIIKEAAAVVSPDTFVSIKDADALPIAEGKKALAPEPAPAALLKQNWIERNKTDDVKIDATVHVLQSQGLEETADLETITKESKPAPQPQSQPRPQRETQPQSPATKSQRPPDSETKTIPSSEHGLSGDGGSTPAGGTNDEAKPVPKTLKITAKGSLEAVTEGDAIPFAATLVMNDGSTRIITTEAQWRVVGPIGSIAPSGIFSAQLDPLVAEEGTASGSVVASWTDPRNGAVFFNSTAIFAVNAAVPQTPLDIGGQ